MMDNHAYVPLKEDGSLSLIFHFLMRIVYLLYLHSILAYKCKYYWLQLIFPLLVAILFAVDTGLLLSTEEQFKSVLEIQKTGKYKKVETELLT